MGLMKHNFETNPKKISKSPKKEQLKPSETRFLFLSQWAVTRSISIGRN